MTSLKTNDGRVWAYLAVPAMIAGLFWDHGVPAMLGVFVLIAVFDGLLLGLLSLVSKSDSQS